jgi:predicted acylesterase/phospholipase RssA/CRP-like cAMP-binding protein
MTPATVPDAASSEEVARLVEESAVFGSLSADAREFLSSRLEVLPLRSGEALMREGDDPDALYLIVVGRLRVSMTRADQIETVVAELGRGEVVGEMALMTNEPRSATVTAVRDSEVLRLPTDAYAELVQRFPDALREITTQLVRRLVRSLRDGPPTSPIETIAVVPLGRSPAVMEFDERLHAALHRLTGASNHVTIGAMVAALGDLDSVSGERLASWFAKLETGYQVVVYEAHEEPGPWTEACVRQADLVLLVGDAREPPRLRAVEEAIAHRRSNVPCRVQLVLVHPEGTRDPRGTSRWLAPRSVDRHHHVAVHRDDDVDRVARLLLGRGVGIVFSGGGARGIAGIGVVQALHELGIPVDAVGGSSIGSIIGGGVARGQTADEIAEMLRSAVVESSPFDVTFPAVSLAAGRRVTKHLQDGAEGLDIEDGWRTFFCVSTNLTRGKVEVHRRGPGWLAVRASFSIPGLFPPVLSETGDVLVDGGVLDNMPIGIMREEHHGVTVIAVDVGRTREFSAAGLPGDGVVSGWKMLLDKVDPRVSNRQSLGIARVLMRLTEMGGKHDNDRGDITIRPAVDPFSLADFKAFDRLVALGYEAGVRSLGEWSDSPAARALLGR